MADLFFIISNIKTASYTDDNTPYIAADILLTQWVYWQDMDY